MNKSTLKINYSLVFIILSFFAVTTIYPSNYQTPTTSGKPHLAKGVFLVANEDLSDPNFRQTAILITEYSDIGTAGLVLNRPSPMSVEKFFSRMEGLISEPGNIFVGGPVAIERVQVLVNADVKLNYADQIIENVYLINNSEAFIKFGESGRQGNNARLYAGFAGWAPGQLESELLRGDWYLWHANVETVFASEIDSIWLKLVQLTRGQWVKNQSILPEVLHNSGNRSIMPDSKQFTAW